MTLPIELRGLEHIALIGNFLPRKCGIATYTTDTHTALAAAFPNLKVDVYAMDDHPGRYAYPPEVVRAIPQDDRSAYLDAARAIEASGAQALWLQHEYGIFGGSAGDFILAVLDRVSIPVIVTLHTILQKPDAEQRRVMEALLRRSARVIVMAERGREILQRVYGASGKSVLNIPHGVPDRPFVDPNELKPRFGWKGRDVILTFGLLAPGKGIETMIEAMPDVVAQNPRALYVVLGATHPNLVAHEGEKYRDRLAALAAERGVGFNVEFIDAFVDHEPLLDYLQAADIYATPYVNPAQITSGTLSYAVGVGKAVVSTPYVHATEILADGHGVLVDFGDAAAFAREINALLGSSRNRIALSKRAYARGRTMLWPRLAETAMAEMTAMVAAQPRRIATPAALNPLRPDIAAVERMSDATGMMQHSIYSVPDRRHGYCIDDNARALMLMSRIEDLDETLRDKWTTIYSSFVQYAWNPDKRRFRNFMNYDRTWCEETGSEDSNGRTLWALGVTARDARQRKHRDWADALYDTTASLALELQSPRAQGFAMLGAAAMIEAHSGHDLSRTILSRFGDDLVALLEAARRPEWQWFEIVLAYDNARLPEALLRAGTVLKRDDFVRVGLETLDWIISKQTSPEGRFRAIGSESFGRAYADPLPFDQQPLEAQATIDACVAAFDATGDVRWIAEAKRAYHWFLGVNDHDLPLTSGADGGCFDGLTPVGLNRNQGAESILALQLASVAHFWAFKGWRKHGNRALAPPPDPDQPYADTGYSAGGVVQCWKCKIIRCGFAPTRRGSSCGRSTSLGRATAADRSRSERLVREVLDMSAAEARAQLEVVLKDFEARHWQTRRVFMTRYDEIEAQLGFDGTEIGDEKRQLIGAYFCHEYSYAAAALMNPSAVPHFDQSGMPAGSQRILMSMRAVGEGHISIDRVPRRHHHRQMRAEAGARAAVRDRHRCGRQRRGAYAGGAGDRLPPPRFDAVGHGDFPDHAGAVEGAGGSAHRPVHPRRRQRRVDRHLHRL